MQLSFISHRSGGEELRSCSSVNPLNRVESAGVRRIQIQCAVAFECEIFKQLFLVVKGYLNIICPQDVVTKIYSENGTAVGNL